MRVITWGGIEGDSSFCFLQRCLPRCGHLWGIRGIGSNSQVTLATVDSTWQHAVPIGSVAGAWRLARSLLFDQELAKDQQLPDILLRILFYLAGGRFLLACVHVLSLAKPCDVGFLPSLVVSCGWHWVAGEKPLFPEGSWQSSAAAVSILNFLTYSSLRRSISAFSSQPSAC